MDKDNFIQTTAKLYKITVLFPKKEPLRYKLREVADNILSDLITWNVINSIEGYNKTKEEENLLFNLKKNLEVINSYFEIAKWQNWVSFFDILEIQEECANIWKNIKIESEKLQNTEKPLKIHSEIKQNKLVAKKEQDLDERKQKILKILKEKEKAQVWEVNEEFPKISKRTIRRDFAELLSYGLIERLGEKNNTFYQLKEI